MSDPDDGAQLAVADHLARLARLDTCAVSDALDALGVGGILLGIRPLACEGTLVGTARTVQLRERDPVRDSAGSTVHLGATAIQRASKSDVIVIANRRRVDSGAWGGLLSAAAAIKGVRGVIVDGACRDVAEAAQLGFCVFARDATPVTARGRTVEEATDVEIEIDGVTVAVGDLILADRDGVAVVPRAHAGEVLARAERFAKREMLMLHDLQEGLEVTDVLGRSYEQMLET